MGIALATLAHTAMDHDLENEALIGEEGKKRSRGDIDELPDQDDTNKNSHRSTKKKDKIYLEEDAMNRSEIIPEGKWRRNPD
ncbi:hypothetical protein J1N35_033766 [Gossypium stocksii]|uniref:Uncharacterized protein n=1 Tax=Gossypium stocksii TaxID=47602 RepID=A0A9D3ZNN5_9ROSI|nr:hypothetical protein J1N35_033766 [Gossypium stocksii]